MDVLLGLALLGFLVFAAFKIRHWVENKWRDYNRPKIPEMPEVKHEAPRGADFHVSYEIRDTTHWVCTVDNKDYPSFAQRNLPTLCITLRLDKHYRSIFDARGVGDQTITDYEVAEPDKEMRRITGRGNTYKYHVSLRSLLTTAYIPRKTRPEVDRLLEEIRSKLLALKAELDTHESTPEKGSFDI